MIIFDLEQDSLENFKKFAEEQFTTSGIKVTESIDMGLKELSFPIKDKKKGHYYLFNAESEPKSLKELEQPFRLKKGILRYMTIRKK